MKTKITEVARFVESLEEGTLEGRQSMLLEGEFDGLTGAANSKCTVNQVPYCTNNWSGCPNPTNQGITDCGIEGPGIPYNPSCPTNLFCRVNPQCISNPCSQNPTICW